MQQLAPLAHAPHIREDVAAALLPLCSAVRARSTAHRFVSPILASVKACHLQCYNTSGMNDDLYAQRY